MLLISISSLEHFESDLSPETFIFFLLINIISVIFTKLSVPNFYQFVLCFYFWYLRYKCNI